MEGIQGQCKSFAIHATRSQLMTVFEVWGEKKKKKEDEPFQKDVNQLHSQGWSEES